MQISRERQPVGNPRVRRSMENCLPQDVIEAILGFLDRDTLWTARLVSKTLSAAAAAHICRLTLTSTSQAVSLHHFPRLQAVTFRHNDSESLADIEPGVRNLITTCSTSGGPGSISEPLSQLALMPKLRELDVDFHVGAAAALLRHCTNLEILRVGDCGLPGARTIVTMTSLTRLWIGSVYRTSYLGEIADVSWLRDATALGNLQALYISSPKEGVPLIGNLTGLTGLTWTHEESPHRVSMEEATYSISPFTNLTRLRSLQLGYDPSERNLATACSLGSGSMVNLQIWIGDEASADCGRFLTHQTALTRLFLGGPQLGNLWHFGALRIELLQCLQFNALDTPDAEGLLALRRATSLTKLLIGTDISQQHLGLSQAVAQLTQLRSLELIMHGSGVDTKVLDFPLALCPLTVLTKLSIRKGRLDDGDMRALLVLTGLQFLWLDGSLLTNNVVPELVVLTNLSTLIFGDCAVTSLEPVIKVLKPMREARGWQPLYTVCR